MQDGETHENDAKCSGRENVWETVKARWKVKPLCIVDSRMLHAMALNLPWNLATLGHIAQTKSPPPVYRIYLTIGVKGCVSRRHDSNLLLPNLFNLSHSDDICMLILCLFLQNPTWEVLEARTINYETHWFLHIFCCTIITLHSKIARVRHYKEASSEFRAVWGKAAPSSNMAHPPSFPLFPLWGTVSWFATHHASDFANAVE